MFVIVFQPFSDYVCIYITPDTEAISFEYQIGSSFLKFLQSFLIVSLSAVKSTFEFKHK